MTKKRIDWLTARFGSLATGTKMLMILGLALLPLLLVAILASYNSARTSRLNDVIEAQTTLALSAQRLSSVITRATVSVRVASDAIAELDAAAAARGCERAAAQLREAQVPPLGFALFASANRLACTTPGFTASPPALLGAGALSEVRLDTGRQVLRVLLYDDSGQAQGQIEIPQSSLAAVARPGDTRNPVELELIAAGGASMPLFSSFGGGARAAPVQLREAILGERLELTLRARGGVLTWVELLLILLPILLWLLAALIGWAVVKRLLLRPLSEMQRAILAYRPGEAAFALPARRSPAREIDALGTAFGQVTRTVERHEADLEAAVERQTRLVREVHHRVKNNLQVVASLLNLHARGAANEDVAAAYASIQRRVDALAVVHRNHYAELEENRGVALKALLSELGASLRASAPGAAASMQIRLSVEPFYATQDVAVSVAFLVTEVVEFGMLCGARLVSIALDDEAEGRARLTLESDGLAGEAACAPALQERFDRIVTGLSRQLRSALDKDVENGRYSLTIAVVGRQGDY